MNKIAGGAEEEDDLDPVDAVPLDLISWAWMMQRTTTELLDRVSTGGGDGEHAGEVGHGDGDLGE